MLPNNKFACKKTKDYRKLEDRLKKNGHFSIAYKKTAYNEDHLY